MSVYFIQVGRAVVKIGYSANPYQRRRTLACGAPYRPRLLAFIEGDREDESQAHKQFSEYRLRGDLFRLDGALREFIRTLPKRYVRLFGKPSPRHFTAAGAMSICR